MSDQTYNTDHSCVRVSAEAVLRFAEDTGHDFVESLADAGFACEIDRDASAVTDIYLEGSYYGETQQEALKRIAPYVDAGSFLVFYGGGSPGVWAVVFDRRKEVSDGIVEEDVAVIPASLLLRTVDVLKEEEGLDDEVRAVLEIIDEFRDDDTEGPLDGP